MASLHLHQRLLKVIDGVLRQAVSLSWFVCGVLLHLGSERNDRLTARRTFEWQSNFNDLLQDWH